MRLFLGLLFVLFFSSAHAQDILSEPKSLLTVNAISLVDPYGPPGLRVGLDRSLSSSFTIGVELCGFYDWYPADGDKFQGAACRLSAIYWYKPGSPGEAVGIEAGISYKQTAGMVGDSIRLDVVPTYYRDYHLDRRVLIARLCYVYRSRLTDRFWMERYIGFGVRFKNATSAGITQEELDARQFGDEPGDPGLIIPFVHASGRFVLPDFVVGVRFGLGLK